MKRELSRTVIVATTGKCSILIKSTEHDECVSMLLLLLLFWLLDFVVCHHTMSQRLLSTVQVIPSKKSRGIGVCPHCHVEPPSVRIPPHTRDARTVLIMARCVSNDLLVLVRQAQNKSSCRKHNNKTKCQRGVVGLCGTRERSRPSTVRRGLTHKHSSCRLSPETWRHAPREMDNMFKPIK